MEGTRPATRADVPRLAELARRGIAELTPTKGGALWARREARQQPVEASLEADLGDEAAHVVVGEIDEAAIAYGVVRVEQLADGTALGVITDLYTEPEAREVGVGEAVMGALLDWCRERGCVGVDALALPGNRQTKNFFESFGLVARAIVVHKPL